MSTSFKKNELIDLLQLLGLKASAKSVKAKLEADIVKHIANHPGDVQIDERLTEFIDKSADVDNEVLDNEEEEETSAEEKVEEKIDEVVHEVVGTWAKLNKQRAKLHARVRNSAAHTRSNLSTVASVNWTLTLADFFYATFLMWPRSLAGRLNRDPWDVVQRGTKEFLLYHLLFVLIPLVFSFVVNFTTKSAIRRKKHVYIVDPILYGLSRFVIAMFVHASATLEIRYSSVAAAAGLTSALVGIYASVLQTP